MSGEGEFTVRVDRSRCIGSGHCAATAPGELALAADGRVEVRRATSDAGDELADAADLCPVEAISVYLTRTGELIAPRE